MKIFKVFISVFLISITTYASAGPVIEYLNAELEVSDRLMASIGYYPTDISYTTIFKDDFKKEYFREYQTNKEYIISGVCDYNCHDVDMYVYDSSNNLIAKGDNTTGNKSMISFITTNDEYYDLHIMINDCDVSRCFFKRREYIKK